MQHVQRRLNFKALPGTAQQATLVAATSQNKALSANAAFSGDLLIYNAIADIVYYKLGQGATQTADATCGFIPPSSWMVINKGTNDNIALLCATAGKVTFVEGMGS